MNLLPDLFDAPTADWILFAASLAGIVIFIFIAEKTRLALGWPAEVTRKLVHISVGIMIFFTPYYFNSNRPLIWMAVLFIIINFIGIRAGKLKGMHGTSRSSYGTVFYPLTFLILVLLCWHTQKVVLMLAMLILALPDALAAIVGENLKHPHEYKLGEDKKSIEGSFMMALSTFLIVFLIAPVIGKVDGITISRAQAAWIGFLTALIATALESISSKGSDNLTAPLGSAFVIWFMLNQSKELRIQLTLGCGLAMLIAIFAIKVKFLNAGGAVATFILATIIFGTGGWAWTLPILTFFILSSILSRTGKNRKKRLASMFEKSGQRDVGQVIANGGLPGILVLLNTFFPDQQILYVAYLGAISAVNADTWATEIGVLSKTQPQLITTGKHVPHGISGGITPIGLFGAILGSFIIGLCGWIANPFSIDLSIMNFLFWWIVLTGFLSSLIDSLLGASVQGQYICKICHRATEKQKHCNHETHHATGWQWINNDKVNLICALFGVFFIIFGWIIGICH